MRTYLFLGKPSQFAVVAREHGRRTGAPIGQSVRPNDFETLPDINSLVVSFGSFTYRPGSLEDTYQGYIRAWCAPDNTTEVEPVFRGCPELVPHWEYFAEELVARGWMAMDWHPTPVVVPVEYAPVGMRQGTLCGLREVIRVRDQDIRANLGLVAISRQAAADLGGIDIGTARDWLKKVGLWDQWRNPTAPIPAFLRPNRR